MKNNLVYFNSKNLVIDKKEQTVIALRTKLTYYAKIINVPKISDNNTNMKR